MQKKDKRGFVCKYLLSKLCETKVAYFDIPLIIQQQIQRLEIPMNNT